MKRIAIRFLQHYDRYIVLIRRSYHQKTLLIQKQDNYNKNNNKYQKNECNNSIPHEDITSNLNEQQQHHETSSNKPIAKLYTSLFRNHHNNNNNENRNSNEWNESLSSTQQQEYQYLIDYTKGWAWQNLILQRRLDLRRKIRDMDEDKQKDHITTSLKQQQQEEEEENLQLKDYVDHDAIFMFEHNHVYTLGRGSNENFLTFLSLQSNNTEINKNNNQSNNHKNDENCTNDHEEVLKRIRYQLSRKHRGPGTSRLCMNQKRYVYAHDTDDQIEKIVNQLFPNPTIAGKQMIDYQNHPNELGIIPVIAPNNVPTYRIERGGEVTYHGPGQLVVYPMLDLLLHHNRKADLHWFINIIEEIIIQTLHVYNIHGYRDDINTGVWVTEEVEEEMNRDDSNIDVPQQKQIIQYRNKIAAVGIASSRWITTHGFALNVNPNLQYFDPSTIIPCGIMMDNENEINTTTTPDTSTNTTTVPHPSSSSKKTTTIPNDHHDHQYYTKPFIQVKRGVTSIERILRNRNGDATTTNIPTIEHVAQTILEKMESILQLHIEYGRYISK